MINYGEKKQALTLYQNHTQQNCTLFSYLRCKYEQIKFQTFFYYLRLKV